MVSTDEFMDAVERIEEALRRLAQDLSTAGQARYAVRSEDLATTLAHARYQALRNRPEVRDLAKTQPNLEAAAAAAAGRNAENEEA